MMAFKIKDLSLFIFSVLFVYLRSVFTKLIWVIYTL